MFASPPKYLTLLFVLQLVTFVSAQTVEDFTNKYTQVYLNLSDQSKAKQLAMEAYELLESNEQLQQYGNYIILQSIFEHQLQEMEMAGICEKKANALLSPETSFKKPDSYDTPELEWAYEYQIELTKPKDLVFGKQALNFLTDHEQLWNYTNFAAVAYFFDQRGDFKKAADLYERGLHFAGKDANEVVSLLTYAMFLFKSGDYQKVEELILLNDRLLRSATPHTKLTYQVTGQMIRMFYNLNIGDYVGYIKSSNQYYEFIEKQQNTDLGYDAYAHPRLTNRALGEEFSGQYEKASESWAQADAAWKLANSKLSETYPNNPTYYYATSTVFEAKRGNKIDTRRAIQELEDYYSSFEKVIPLTYGMQHLRAQQYGFYRDPSYSTLFEHVIRQLPKTRDYTESTMPLANYAYFLMRDDKMDRSFQTYKRLFRENLNWINDIIFTFGEKAFVAYYANKIKGGYDNYHSFVKHSLDLNTEFSPVALEIAYNNLLLTKSIAFKGVRKRKKAFRLANTPEINRLYETWIEKKQDLIKYYQVVNGSQSDQNTGLLTQSPDNLISQDSLELLQQEVNLLANKLAAEAKDFQHTLQISNPDWKATRKQLEPGEAAIEMVKFEWRDQVYYSDTVMYAAYIVKYDSKYPEVVYLPSSADDLESRHYAFYKNAIKLKFEDTKSYDHFWKPVASRLQGVKKVYFSPDGIFHMISLPTLKNPETGNYLLEELEVQNVTSTQEIKRTEKMAIKTSTLFGRPSYKNDLNNDEKTTTSSRSFVRNFKKMDVADLPGTEEEVVAISAILNDSKIQTTTYLAADASESEFYEMKDPDILHIATHGYWSEEEDHASSGYNLFNALVNSGLLLSGVVNYYQAEEPAFTDDGILTAYEAQNLSLEGTDLVVLSACETGLGSVNAGEGVYGLQRAFRTAGAKSLITSLWKVDDEGTRDFMIAFYRNLLESKDIYLSFRQAQQQMQKKYAHPYYWGAFVLVGE